MRFAAPAPIENVRRDFEEGQYLVAGRQRVLGTERGARLRQRESVDLQATSRTKQDKQDTPSQSRRQTDRIRSGD